MLKLSHAPALVIVGLLLAGSAVFYGLSRPAESELSAPEPSRRPAEAVATAQPGLISSVPEVKRILDSLPSASAHALPALPASSSARKGLLAQNVGQLYQQALDAKNPEDRSLALSVSAECFNVLTSRQLTLKELFKDTAGEQAFENPMVAVYDGLMASSRQELQAFCSTGDSGNFMDKMKVVQKSTGQASGRIWRGVLQMGKVNLAQRQEFFQAMTQVLSSPSQYPAHFDRWTRDFSFLKLTKLHGADYVETGLIGDSLLVRFGMEYMVEYRQLRRCGLEAICFKVGMLPEAKRRRIDMAAGQIEQLIRTQRWDVLLAE